MENQDFGPMPPAHTYDPDGMNPKKKAEFERWYAEEVRNEHIFNLCREMEKYCEYALSKYCEHAPTNPSRPSSG